MPDGLVALVMALAMLLMRLGGRLMAVERRATMFSLVEGSLRAVVAASATWQLMVVLASSKKRFSSLESDMVALMVVMCLRAASLALSVKTDAPAPSRASEMSVADLLLFHTSKAKSLKAPLRIM